MGTKKKTNKVNLIAGRPPLRRIKSISRKATKALINKHHQLEKKKQQALARGDETKAAAICAEIEALGGIKRYQEASLQGQRADRGGDSSRVLVEWLKPSLSSTSGPRPLRMLEIGALSRTNACSKCGYFDMERIDLNSQGEGIIQQDFMERPLPRDNTELFDIISLSLVLNFVPDPQGRGEMLSRILQFLRDPPEDDASSNSLWPGLFLVLPAPCVMNSRYLDEPRLEAIMVSLGYTKVLSKTTQRLVYYLWKRKKNLWPRRASFSKKELHSGQSRNNFAIVMKGSNR